VFVGSYGPDGLAVATADPASGDLTVGAVAPVADVSWLAAGGRALYATNEHDGGSVTVLDPASLAVLRVLPTFGDEPTHLSVAAGGRLVLVANHGSAGVAVLPVDGGPGSSVALPAGARPHQVVVDPGGAWVLVVALGLDLVLVYRLVDGALVAHGRTGVGPGPRHLVWHPDGVRCFVVCENAPVVVGCSWDAGGGELTVRRSTRIAGAGYPGEGVMPADGRLLHVTNRGENTVVTLDTDLAVVDTVDSGGDWPRHAALDAGQRWLYVANQRSGQLSRLARDPRSGRLSEPAGATRIDGVAVVLP
jgi:6-phosphogluconolactonase